MNQIEQNNMNFWLNNYKDIIKNSDGTFSLHSACVLKDGKVHFLKDTNNQFTRNCYGCKYCEPGKKDYCLLRAQLEHSDRKFSVNDVADCEAYDPLYCLNIINTQKEMIDFVESVERYFDCIEDYEKYFGFSLKWNEETGKVLETIKEYYKRDGEFNNIPDKYPCVIYFSKLDPDTYFDEKISLKWIYIGEQNK